MMSENAEGRDHSNLAEHLRMIHFALTLTCAALLIATFLASPVEIERAHTQIREIIDSTREWDGGSWFNDQIAKLIDSCIHLPEFLKTEGNNRPLVIQLKYVGLFGLADNFLGTPNPLLKDYRRSPIIGLHTLKDFQELWDFLEKANAVLCPSADGPKVLFESESESSSSLLSLNAAEAFDKRALTAVRFELIGKAEPELIAELKLFPFGEPVNPLYDGPYRDTESKQEVQKYFKDFGVEGFSPPKKDRVVGVMPQHSAIWFAFGNLRRGVKNGKGQRGLLPALHVKYIILPVYETHPIPVDGQGIFISYMSSKGILVDWNRGGFDYSFRELSKITKNYSDLSLTQIEQVLQSEQERSSERFEAIGIKLPAGAVRTWGIVVMIAIQLYFYLHLVRFASSASATDKAWSFPWIALYSGAFPRTVFGLSALIFPVGVAATIVLYTAMHQKKSVPWWGYALSLLPIFISAALSSLSWRAIRRFVRASAQAT